MQSRNRLIDTENKLLVTKDLYKMESQRTITKIREKEKNPRRTAKLYGDYQPLGKDFRLLMLKMMQDIGNKLEAKIHKLEQTLSKEIQDLKFKQAKMQNKKFIRSNQQQNIETERMNK